MAPVGAVRRTRGRSRPSVLVWGAVACVCFLGLTLYWGMDPSAALREQVALFPPIWVSFASLILTWLGTTIPLARLRLPRFCEVCLGFLMSIVLGVGVVTLALRDLISFGVFGSLATGSSLALGSVGMYVVMEHLAIGPRNKDY